ncbi:hypothetical protein AAY24_03675 [Sedimenticola thiotaurini]|uniref:Uncharacterized protein n=1 Tax=Sedimenticola thiotaurini TaxID=1543721 RepID=A0A0F7JXV2_9GAMM|nr:hypothetical protein AAY24_03675 [Sedimenticola thiotaurini]
MIIDDDFLPAESWIIAWLGKRRDSVLGLTGSVSESIAGSRHWTSMANHGIKRSELFISRNGVREIPETQEKTRSILLHLQALIL